MTTLRTLANSLCHLFYPQLCYGCGSDAVNNNQFLCLHCIHKLPYTGFQFHEGNPVEKIFTGRLNVSKAASIFFLSKDSKLEKLIYQLKYKGRKDIGEHLGKLMGYAIVNSPFNKADLLLPLPLFRKKQNKRGFNQSEVLCAGITSITGVKVLTSAIERSSSTATQTKKNRIERWQNMEGRFIISDPSRIAGKHVMLVDDVVTTGATLEACGREILRAGGEVSILTLAYAVGK